MNVRLGPIEFGLVLDLQVNDEVQVVPDEVILIIMSIETFLCIAVELKSKFNVHLRYTC